MLLVLEKDNENCIPEKESGYCMKRWISLLMAATLLMLCLLVGTPRAYASTKMGESRAIAIVFDNSGSMYQNGNRAWCQATYAMEVFASMLNAGDVLQIYPMWPITVDNKTYSMDLPLQIDSSAQASVIRDIYTERASGTPIESIDCAASGLKKIQADKKYMIVLTDGGTFSKNGGGLSTSNTKKELDNRIGQYAGTKMAIMYLGIGSSACMPDTEESAYFSKKQVVNTADVLSTLTTMCNQIFGRDTLPDNRISGNTINFDVSMSKLIVFIQGDNISNVKITGSAVGKLVSTQQTKYSTKGAGNHSSTPDTSLQGMMVTYEDCGAGTYSIEYTGTATSVEVYYEPNTDLDFVFTDSDGNTVDPKSLYEGDYKVSFGMKDAVTGKLISSDLLGNPQYQGSYSINGKEHSFTHEGFSGSVDIPLKTEDKFEAKLTVTYLSGYTITKNSSDFGWPQGGIQIAPRPAGELRLEIFGGDEVYSLQALEEGKPYSVKVYYQGALLTGSELERVGLKWQQETSNAELEKVFAEDHWEIYLHYKDPLTPQNTICGDCSVLIAASYTAQGSSEAQAEGNLTYTIKDDTPSVQIELLVPSNYIVIKNLDDSKEIVAKLTIDGRQLTAEEFERVELLVDCDGIAYTITPCQEESAYRIKLLSTDGIEEGKYQIKVIAKAADAFGETRETSESTTVTLSTVARWVKWTIRLLLLLILAIIVWSILHIKVLPVIQTSRRLSSMNFDGDDVTQSTNFLAEIKKKSVKIQGQYGGKKFGVAMDVKPGKESYLYKPNKRKSAEVKVASVKKYGSAKIQEAMIGSAKYISDETSGKLVPALPNQKPFMLTNGMMIKFSGTIQDGGIEKDFEVASKLNFKKK